MHISATSSQKGISPEHGALPAIQTPPLHTVETHQLPDNLTCVAEFIDVDPCGDLDMNKFVRSPTALDSSRVKNVFVWEYIFGEFFLFTI